MSTAGQQQPTGRIYHDEHFVMGTLVTPFAGQAEEGFSGRGMQPGTGTGGGAKGDEGQEKERVTYRKQGTANLQVSCPAHRPCGPWGHALQLLDSHATAAPDQIAG